MDEYNFKTAVFGGFDKKSVVDYISDLMYRYKEKIDDLKKDYEAKLFSKNEEISDKQTKCDIYSVEIQNLKSKLSSSKDEFSFEMKSRDESIKVKDEIIGELENKVKLLEAEVSKFKNENSNIELKIKTSERDAKERVDRLINQARTKIAREYKAQLDDSDVKCKLLREKAVGEASKIVNSAAERAHKITIDAKQEIEEFIKSAKIEAENIINSANLLAEKMLRDSAKVLVKKCSSLVSRERKLNVNVDYKSLADKIDRDVLEVSKNIENMNYEDKTEISGKVEGESKSGSGKVPVMSLKNRVCSSGVAKKIRLIDRTSDKNPFKN